MILLKIYIVSTIVILFLTYRVFETGMVSSNICIFLGTIAIIPVINTLLCIKLFITIFNNESCNVDLSEYTDMLEECDKYGEKIKKFLGL
jgi:hypothetical protein